ncbi:hypothetical protein PSI9734_02375 [Pseudidiomarina piscicola]|uniref:Uncharacterized protein n=1 Tax=Pseudidiomarina piscicola TaxID=2614830 RepID=A0A7D9N2P4_9GAMM|nr:hypothetical protein [Pseudidiomarina piscicola]CAB0152027.1 hypothetical protein PSI9734_02375 [Pseudidiomarina piscicola]VZT41469.1 hypothetical protein PSI9734_02375 [Pseudomonas aeruginosa]
MPKIKFALAASVLLSGCQVTPLPVQHSVNVEQQREVAMRAYKQGDYHLAQGLLQKLADAPIADPQAPCFLGAIYYRQHEYPAALKNFERCRQAQPEQLEIWLNSAAVHLRMASELLLAGRSYRPVTADSLAPSIESHYTELLNALMKLQRLAEVKGTPL